MLLEWWSDTDCTLYTDPTNYSMYGKENAIVILNHNFEIDFLCGWNFCERFGVLGVSISSIMPLSGHQSTAIVYTFLFASVIFHHNCHFCRNIRKGK